MRQTSRNCLQYSSHSVFSALFFVLLCISNCKKKEQDAVADRLSGTWIQGSRSEPCQQLAGTPYAFKKTQRITPREMFYQYELLYEIFDSAKCSDPVIRNRVSGNYAIGDRIEGEKDMHVLFHRRSNLSAVILNRATLDKTNLKASNGLQPGERLCQLRSDWKLFQEISIKGKTCALSLITQSYEKALNAISFGEGGKLTFGEDVEGEFQNFPRPLIEVKKEEWYKLSVL